MKTEISRDSHLPEKRYSGVYQQQGRMLTDADWNELVEILKDRLDDALKDVVGNKHSSVGGTPRHRALKITKSAGSPLTIESGHVYVDGHHAEAVPDPSEYPPGTPAPKTFEYDKQLDFPSPPTLPTSPENYVVYADVWERTVTHLMDDDLRDHGLHGADTCSRKQMMAQVKWCPVGIPSPEQSSKNPTKGDATLTATLLKKSVEPDPCDPCAAEVGVEAKVGNYLFRVEVHDVNGDADDATEITLKWSSENGAEQYPIIKDADGNYVSPPDSFKNGIWAYEFFDEVSEKHLGVHLDSNFSPSREELTAGYPTTVPDRDFVRRWDGFCVLSKDGGSWDIEKDTDGTILGMDKGAALQDADSSALGFITIETGTDGSSRLVAKLTNTEIDLTLTKEVSGSIEDCSFVAGDFWLADVREIEHSPGSVLIENKSPQGIEHHYLSLGTVSSGDLDDNPEADRKYAFPPLTEMTRLFTAGGDGQEVVPGNPLPQPLRVGVANGEWPVEGAEVRFQVVDASDNPIGTETIATTDPEGIAEFDWTPDSAIDATNRVKATLVDPHDTTQDLDHPPVYFYANLITADQVAYASLCDAPIPADTVHHLLANDSPVPALEHGYPDYYTVKEVLDALLCKLRAKHIPFFPADCDPADLTPTVKSGLAITGNTNVHDVLQKLICKLDAGKIPYDPTQQPQRWADINEDTSSPITVPNTVQTALDNLVENLESSDIKYAFPTCVETPSLPSFKSLIYNLVQNKFTEGGKSKSKIEDLWDALMCHLAAATLPYNSTIKETRWDELIDEGDPKPTTVQQAIDELVDYRQGGGCSVTVGEGGDFATLKSFFDSDEYKNASHIRICLLPRDKETPHTIEDQTVSGKHSFSMTGHGYKVLIRKQLVVKANHIDLSGIHFSAVDKGSKAEKGSGFIIFSAPEDAHVVVENCRFSRVFYGKEGNQPKPLVTVDNLTNLKWIGNRMDVVRQEEEILEAAIPKREMIPVDTYEIYDKLKTLWLLNPHEDPEDFYVKATSVAEKLKALPGDTRNKWYDHRNVTLIDGLPKASVRIRRPTIIGRRPDRPPRPIPTPISPIIRERAERVAEVLEISPQGEVKRLFDLIKATDSIDTLIITEAIRNVASLINKPDYALALTSNRVWGWIENNHISGYVALHSKQKKALPSAWGSTESNPRRGFKEAWAKELDKSLSPERQLNISGNHFTAVHSMMAEDTLLAIHKILKSGSVSPGITIQAYESVTVRDNTFSEEGSSFIGEFLNIAGNHFPFPAGENILAHVLGFAGVFLGNQALELKGARIDQILTNPDAAANLLKIV